MSVFGFANVNNPIRFDDAASTRFKPMQQAVCLQTTQGYSRGQDNVNTTYNIFINGSSDDVMQSLLKQQKQSIDDKDTFEEIFDDDDGVTAVTSPPLRQQTQRRGIPQPVSRPALQWQPLRPPPSTYRPPPLRALPPQQRNQYQPRNNQIALPPPRRPQQQTRQFQPPPPQPRSAPSRQPSSYQPTPQTQTPRLPSPQYYPQRSQQQPQRQQRQQPYQPAVQRPASRYTPPAQRQQSSYAYHPPPPPPGVRRQQAQPGYTGRSPIQGGGYRAPPPQARAMQPPPQRRQQAQTSQQQRQQYYQPQQSRPRYTPPPQPPPPPPPPPVYDNDDDYDDYDGDRSAVPPPRGDTFRFQAPPAGKCTSMGFVPAAQAANNAPLSYTPSLTTQNLTACNDVNLSFGGEVLNLGQVLPGEALVNDGSGQIVGAPLPAPFVSESVSGVQRTFFTVPPVLVTQLTGQDVSSRTWYYNTGSFNTITGTFTVAARSKFRITAQVAFDNSVTNVGKRTLMVVRVSPGAPVTLLSATEQSNPNTNFPTICMVAGVVFLNTGDQIVFEVQQTASIPVDLNTLPEYNTFTIDNML